MKSMYRYVLPLLLVGLLCFLAKSKFNCVDISVPSSDIDAERSFVWINSDSLEKCIMKTYPQNTGVKVSKGRRHFEVEYPFGRSILLHRVGEGAKANLEALNNVKFKDVFKCDTVDYKKVKITLDVEDGYVNCPTALLVPLLHKNKNN